MSFWTGLKCPGPSFSHSFKILDSFFGFAQNVNDTKAKEYDIDIYKHIFFFTFGGSSSSWWKSFSRGLTASSMPWFIENEGCDIPGGHSI